MKNCRDIWRDLSAYLDDELTPLQRTEVEAHLTSCAHCQQELLDLKKLVTGVVTLPKLQPPPRFLAEVRRRIAGVDKPEALTWLDYVFRPFWLKVPFEVAALIVIIGLVMRVGQSQPSQNVAPLKLAKAGGDERAASSESEVKTATVGKPQATVADQAAADARRIHEVRNDELSTTPPTAPSPVVGLIRSLEFPRSKPSEIVTVHARVFDDARNRAQQLAARCGGRVVVVPQSKDATVQTLFVELPQEYVAAFKLELSKTSGPSAPLAKGGIAGQSGPTNAGAPSTGVLTGRVATNNMVDGMVPPGLGNNAPTAEPKTVLEIRVVAPAN